jgi:hypothetical protein
MNSYLKGCTTHYAISYRLLAQDVRLRSQRKQCEIFSKQRITITEFSSRTSFLSLSGSFQHCSIVMLILILLLSETKSEETWECADKEICCQILEALDRKLFSHCFPCFRHFAIPKIAPVYNVNISSPQTRGPTLTTRQTC